MLLLISSRELVNPYIPRLRDHRVLTHSLYSSPTSGGGRAATGERARELKLREDKLITILSPQLVSCKRCGRRVKLSLKSNYDPAHWTQHRKRCLARDAPPRVRSSPSPPNTTEPNLCVCRHPRPSSPGRRPARSA